VDHFVTLSHYIARRIWHIFRRESTVIYPPVDVDKFNLTNVKDDFYLTISRLEFYKRIDLIVEAFAHLKKKLIVVGDGPELNKLKAKATPNIDIMGYQPHDVVQDLMQRARAFIFAADEDFGIVNLEAQASGTPVIAFGRGGSLETVNGVFPGAKPNHGTTGIFFKEQTLASLSEAVDWFERHQGDLVPEVCRANAERFSRPRFEREFKQFVESKWEEFKLARRS
jgi:glycosyltransferase involved in cell wall biosynthesis